MSNLLALFLSVDSYISFLLFRNSPLLISYSSVSIVPILSRKGILWVEFISFAVLSALNLLSDNYNKWLVIAVPGLSLFS